MLLFMGIANLGSLLSPIEPDQSMLPMSYFVDDEEDVSEMSETSVQSAIYDRTVRLVSIHVHVQFVTIYPLN